MTTEEIIKQVNVVFIDVLENPAIVINRGTTANDVPDWDSLNHIMLVVEIEKKFNIRFTTEEVRGFNNVGEMVDSIKLKMNG
jgi:acyl carrier protein